MPCVHANGCRFGTLLLLVFLLVPSSYAQSGLGAGVLNTTEELRIPIYGSANVSSRDAYVFEWHLGSIGVLYEDPYNDGETHATGVSILASTGAILGYGLYLATRRDSTDWRRGESPDKSPERRKRRQRNALLLFSPLILLNSRHHVLFTDPAAAQTPQWRTSAFVATETNAFVLKKTPWGAVYAECRPVFVPRTPMRGVGRTEPAVGQVRLRAGNWSAPLARSGTRSHAGPKHSPVRQSSRARTPSLDGAIAGCLAPFGNMKLQKTPCGL